MRLLKLTVLFSCCILLLSSQSAIANDEAERYTDVLLDRVKACIEHDTSFLKKADMQTVVEHLKQERAYLETGSDDFRVKFVGTQGAIEHVLAYAQGLGEITELVGVIHTPMPATPLCVRPSEDPSIGLLDASSANDLDKLLTIRSRAQIVREYLHKGGKLIISYPKGGLEKRSVEQQNIYFEALNQFPELVNWVLSSDALGDEWIGATYLFRDSSQNIYSFSIKASQANDPRDSVEWGLWFGVLTTPAIQQRVDAVFDYLNSVDGPDIRTQFP